MKISAHKIKVDTNKTMTALWLSMGEDELFLSSHAATLLGTSQQNIKQIIERMRNPAESQDFNSSHRSDKSLESQKITAEQREYLVKLKLIKPNDFKSVLYSRELMDRLVKLIDTPETWAIWNQMLTALRNPTANIELQKEIGGLDQVAKVVNAGLAVMSVSIDKQDELIQLCQDKLLANNIQPSNSKYMGNVYHNGTLNSFYKHLNSVFAPTLHEDMAGRDFFTRVLHADNYQDICDYVKGFEMSVGLRRTLKAVQKQRDALLSPAINKGKIYHTKKSER